MKIIDHDTDPEVYSSRFGCVKESEMHRRNKKREAQLEQEYAEAHERLKNAPPLVVCPLSDPRGSKHNCRREECALYVNNACSLVRIAAGEANETAGKRCPLLERTCAAACALNVGGGCILTALGKD